MHTTSAFCCASQSKKPLRAAARMPLVLQVMTRYMGCPPLRSADWLRSQTNSSAQHNRETG